MCVWGLLSSQFGCRIKVLILRLNTIVPLITDELLWAIHGPCVNCLSIHFVRLSDIFLPFYRNSLYKKGYWSCIANIFFHDIIYLRSCYLFIYICLNLLPNWHFFLSGFWIFCLSKNDFHLMRFYNVLLLCFLWNIL